MSYWTVPIGNEPDSTQQVDLDGTSYIMRLRWNERAACWHMDLSALDGTPIVTGVRMVTAWPLLRRCRHASRPLGELFLFDTQNKAAKPTLEDMGTRFQLVYVDASSVAAAAAGAA